PELTDIAEHILGSAQRLQKTLEKFWRYTDLVFQTRESLGSGGPPSVRLADAHLLIRSTAKQKAQSENRGADLDLNLDEGAVLAVDEKHFSTLLEELLDNAFKFSHQGERVSVEYKINPGGETGSLLVRDAGRGMSKSKIEDVGGFMQFERKRYEQQGLGLGLSIVQEITRLYGGELSISSDEGKGTVVEVRLPAAR
ncbi:MAG: ATP-binding protein, partial [Ignavibacteriales bacterium]|nr:ATP-binding protein [Ignavibacteriales bacterium]